MYVYIYTSATTELFRLNIICFVLLNWSDSDYCRRFPFDILTLVCVLIRKQLSRLGRVQNAFELSGSISIAPAGWDGLEVISVTS
jgi:hypothetical protein